MTLTAEVVFKILQRYVNDAEPAVGSAPLARPLPSADETPYEFYQRITNGTGANQGTWIFNDSVSLTVGASQTYDFNGDPNAPLDSFGNPITANRINLILIVNRTETSGNYVFIVARPADFIEYGGPTNDSRIYAGGSSGGYSSVGVLDGTELTIQGGVGTNTVDILVIGS